MDADQFVRAVAEGSVERARQLTDTQQWTPATVQSFDSRTRVAQLVLDEDLGAGQPITSATSLVGDLVAAQRVMVARIRPFGLVAVGSISAAPPIPHTDLATLVPSTTSNTASGTYVNWPASGGGPLAVTATKVRADTKILVQVDLARVYIVTATVAAEFAIQVDGAGTDTRIFGINPFLNTEESVSGIIQLTDVTPGEHTYRLRRRVNAGGGLAWTSGVSTYSMLVTETY